MDTLPIYNAIQNGCSLFIIEKLFHHGAKIPSDILLTACQPRESKGSYKIAGYNNAVSEGLEKSVTSPSVIDFLINKGALVNIQDKISGETPIHLLMKSKGDLLDFPLEAFKLLKKHGANLNATDCHGNTPLDTFIKNRKDSVPSDTFTYNFLINECLVRESFKQETNKEKTQQYNANPKNLPAPFSKNTERN